MTMAELAGGVQCSESFISKIEAGKASPSLNMLHRLAQVLETNMGALFSTQDDLNDVVFRKGQRPTIDHTLRKGRQISLECLLRPEKGQLLQANLHHLEGGAASEGLIAHAGEEFGYVLDGRIELQVGEATYELSAGDTFHFKSEQPHGYRNISDAPAQILWINTPPTY